MAESHLKANLERDAQQALASIGHVASYGKLLTDGSAMERLVIIREAADTIISSLLSENVPVETPGQQR